MLLSLMKTITKPMPAGVKVKKARPAADSTSMVCDVSDGNAFNLAYATPNVPILAAFGGGRLHTYNLEGCWDLDKAAAENAPALFRSIRRLPSKDTPVEWDNLTFQFGPQVFLYADKNQISAFASTAAKAERLATEFGKTYFKQPAPCGGTFYLIEQGRHEISCHSVTLPPETILAPDALNLNYGSGSLKWHQDFVRKLNNGRAGLSIFEGRPGTGKTFYIRHLVGELKGTHRFYFIPTSTLGVLSKPEFTGFWAQQRRNYENRKLAVILEDSDAALMTRDSDNREQVSAILNLTDGLLADFLRLQIICTINCTASDIDPALLRPGRLLCHRVFERLDYVQAARLAESLGRKLPATGDYSLAEVFAGNEKFEIKRPHIGFAASSH